MRLKESNVLSQSLSTLISQARINSLESQVLQLRDELVCRNFFEALRHVLFFKFKAVADENLSQYRGNAAAYRTLLPRPQDARNVSSLHSDTDKQAVQGALRVLLFHSRLV